LYFPLFERLRSRKTFLQEIISSENVKNNIFVSTINVSYQAMSYNIACRVHAALVGGGEEDGVQVAGEAPQ
jgi:hypothetical protein